MGIVFPIFPTKNQHLGGIQDHMPPSTFGKTGTFHKELSFQLHLPDALFHAEAFLVVRMLWSMFDED